MKQAQFRFYADLNDFLPAERRETSFTHAFRNCASVKDMIEAFGIPHTEIGTILVGGEPVDFAHVVQDGDHIGVYPLSAAAGSSCLSRQPPVLSGEPRFIADVHLGQLARYLRLAGFDTLYRNDYRDEEIARVSSQADRILLTRDRGLLKRNMVQQGYYVRANAPRQQLAEILRRFALAAQTKPFCRCTRCNSVLRVTSKADVLDRLPPRTREHYDELRCCPTCDRVYWRGSHYDRLQEIVARALDEAQQ